MPLISAEIPEALAAKIEALTAKLRALEAKEREAQRKEAIRSVERRAARGEITAGAFPLPAFGASEVTRRALLVALLESSLDTPAEELLARVRSHAVKRGPR